MSWRVFWAQLVIESSVLSRTLPLTLWYTKAPSTAPFSQKPTSSNVFEIPSRILSHLESTLPSWVIHSRASVTDGGRSRKIEGVERGAYMEGLTLSRMERMWSSNKEDNKIWVVVIADEFVWPGFSKGGTGPAYQHHLRTYQKFKFLGPTLDRGGAQQTMF